MSGLGHYNIRSAKEMTERVLRYYNGSYLHPDEVVDEVKRIDQRFAGDVVRKHLRELARNGTALVEKTGGGGRVILRYRIWNPDKPYRPYMGPTPHNEPRPGVRRDKGGDR